MNYLLAENITKVYGIKVLFEQIDFSINKGQKIALIARNGAGKSSLMRILVGLDSSDMGGMVRLQKGVKLGYIEQEPQLNPKDTVLSSVFNSDNPVIAVIQRYELALLRHEQNPTDQTQKDLETCIEAMQLNDAWDYETKIKQILTKFKITKLNQSIGEMSGGEKKRVAMASVLIQEPDLVIMDEPTNHLDLETREALAEALSDFGGAIVLVSHDRHLTGLVCNTYWRVADGHVDEFDGDLDQYAAWLRTRGNKAANERRNAAAA